MARGCTPFTPTIARAERGIDKFTGLADPQELNMNKKTVADESMNEWPLRRENPARRALAEVGITQLRQLAKFSEQELLKLHGVGPKAIRLLRAALSTHGLDFAPPDQPSVVSESANRRRPKQILSKKR